MSGEPTGPSECAAIDAIIRSVLLQSAPGQKLNRDDFLTILAQSETYAAVAETVASFFRNEPW